MSDPARDRFPVIKFGLLLAGVLGGCAFYWALFMRDPPPPPSPGAPPDRVPDAHSVLPLGDVGATGLHKLSYPLDRERVGTFVPLVRGYEIAPPIDWIDATESARARAEHSDALPLLWAFKPPTDDGAMMARHVPKPPDGRTFLDLVDATERAMRGAQKTNHVTRVAFEHAGCAVHRVSTSSPGLYSVTYFVLLGEGGAFQIDYLIAASRLDEALGAALLSSFASLRAGG